jgi:hypothetical protein
MGPRERVGVVGILLALWAGRAATTLLYDLKPYDPVSIGLAVSCWVSSRL